MTLTILSILLLAATFVFAALGVLLCREGVRGYRYWQVKREYDRAAREYEADRRAWMKDW